MISRDGDDRNDLFSAISTPPEVLDTLRRLTAIE